MTNKESHNTDQYRKKISSIIKEKWKDDNYRNAIVEVWDADKRNEMSEYKRQFFNKNREARFKQFLIKARKVHNNKYNYSRVDYTNCKSKVKIICPQHGEFKQTPDSHLCCGCPQCAKESRIKHHKLTIEEFIRKANDIHNNLYSYKNTNYVSIKTKIKIICPTHGQFEQVPNCHLNGSGCPECADENRRASCRSTISEFVNKANIEHNHLYDYSRVKYINYQTKVKIICSVHGEFEQTPNNHLGGRGCPQCGRQYGKLQGEIFDYIKSLGFSSIYNDRTQIYPLELDIYVPEKKLAIEFHGLYWHSYEEFETTEERRAHKNKCDFCETKNIKLIQIFENEWRDKQEITKSILMAKLGVIDRIFARKCSIVEISKLEHKRFMDKCHIQGGKGCHVAYGLEYNSELVSVMSFNKHPKYEWEITRFANKLNVTVVGGASKLFKCFIKNHNPVEILTYADRRYSDGNLYRKLGFKFVEHTVPNYFYIKNKKVLFRQQFQKHKLKNKLETFNPDLTEAENMFSNGFRRLWDAGHHKFIWRK